MKKPAPKSPARPRKLGRAPAVTAIHSKPQVPGAPVAAMGQAAQKVTQLMLGADIAPRTVPSGALATSTTYNSRKRSLIGAAISDYNADPSPLMQVLFKALGVDPVALAASLQRQDTAYEGYLLAQGIGKAIGDARQVVSGARVVGRTLVKIAVNSLGSTMNPDDHEVLLDDVAPIDTLEQQELQSVQDTRSTTKKVQDAALAKVSGVDAQRDLQRVLSGLASGESYDFATLVKAADTLEALLAEENDGAPSAIPVPAATSAADRRGPTRG